MLIVPPAPLSDILLSLTEGRLAVVRESEPGSLPAFRLVDVPANGRALSQAEVSTIARAAVGQPLRKIAAEMRVSTGTVSRRLARVTSKIGLTSSIDAIRVFSRILRPDAAIPKRYPLSTAEDEILELLRRGMTNTEIAKTRGRSIRTIANQVGAVLRKRGVTSRRALYALADGPIVDSTASASA